MPKRKIKIAVFGEICQDVFVYSSCSRLSPEAPVPVLKPIETISSDGMAGNVVRNLKNMSSGLIIDKFFQKRKISKTRHIDKKTNHMYLRVDTGEDSPIDRIENIPDLSEYDIVIVSDYNKGFLHEEDLYKIATLSNFSVLDTKKKILPQTSLSFSFVKLNESERMINKDLPDDNLVITLASRGAMFDGIIFSPTVSLETIDVSGAGDTFLSAFSLSYFDTKSVEESIRFANQMSSKVVQKKGVSVPL